MSKSVSDTYSEFLEQKKYAVFFRSFTATVIDAFFITIFYALAIFLLIPLETNLSFFVMVITPFLPVFYVFISSSYMENTLGRVLLKIKVVNGESSNPMTLVQEGKREALFLASILMFFVSPLILNGWIFDKLWLFGDDFSSEWTVSASIGILSLYLFWSTLEVFTMAISPSNRSYKDHLSGTRCIREA